MLSTIEADFYGGWEMAGKKGKTLAALYCKGFRWCGRRDLNPQSHGALDFKSSLYANSSTTANKLIIPVRPLLCKKILPAPSAVPGIG